MMENYQILVLAAGKPHHGNLPSVLNQASFGRCVFDWILDSYAMPVSEVTVVAGFQAEEIKSSYPALNVLVNKNWENTGSLQSMLLTDFDMNKYLFVNYGDVLVRRKTIEQMNASNADIVIAIDSSAGGLPAGTTKSTKKNCELVSLFEGAATRLGYDLLPELADAEFVGVVRFAPAALKRLKELAKTLNLNGQHTSLSEVVELLRSKGDRIEVIDTHGQWVEVISSRDIAHFVLGTKADTLLRLKSVLSAATIQEVAAFTVADWKTNRAQVLQMVRAQFSGHANKLVVRSSARGEDTFNSSNAGGYDSVLNVDIVSELENAIVQVIASYDHGESNDQVLVQPMLHGVRLSGVAFTRTLEHYAPYYVINFDKTGLTDSITSGNSKEHLTLHLRRGVPLEAVETEELRAVIAAIVEIEELLSYDALDIEFAVDDVGGVHIFQVRPIALKTKAFDNTDLEFDAAVGQAAYILRNLQKSPPNLPGSTPSIYSVMTDWNPAEIIGTAPGKLAETLYSYLIMDETWATQRAEYGYRDVRPNPLLISIAGRPYVDVRASFASFIPAALNEDLAGRLLAHYSSQLLQRPELHDKVEFDIVPTCLAPDFTIWEERLITIGGFSRIDITELKEALRDITLDAINQCDSHYEQLVTLEKRRVHIMESDIDPLERARLLLENCRRYGALPFAHLARNGFVAVALLRGAENSGAISSEAHSAFMSTIRTISHKFTADAAKVVTGELEWDMFVADYGHLRPGTYDITSPRYDMDAERFLRPQVNAAAQAKATFTQVSDEAWAVERFNFAASLELIGLPLNLEKVERFLHEGIVGREYAKFIFTRSLSDAIEALAEAGSKIGLSRNDLASLPLKTLLHLRDDVMPIPKRVAELRLMIQNNDQARKLSAAMKLPPLIARTQDLDTFVSGTELANFVGKDEIVAEFVDFEKADSDNTVIVKDLIALIPQADPGYDWLFGQGIIGLVTMYGGVNSHMAIRAAEFGMTAAIGIGEQRYRELAKAKIIRLDPVNQVLCIVS